jgi:hypothetical protein
MHPRQSSEAARRPAALAPKIVLKSSWLALLIASLLPGSSSIIILAGFRLNF